MSSSCRSQTLVFELELEYGEFVSQEDAPNAQIQASAVKLL